MPTKIYDPAFSESSERLEFYADLVAIIKQLRRDCPWDREQTHESVRHLLIEEAYEAVDAIEKGDYDEFKSELGDLLLHVLFHSAIAEEDDRFTIGDVLQAVTDKLVRRHPHVFGDTAVKGVQDVLANWERIKRTEGQRKSALDGVPSNLPALLCAFRIQEKAAGVGFDFSGHADVWAKVEEEIREYKEVIGSSDQEAEFGDVLFALVNYARFSGINPENALRRTNKKFQRRFRYIERHLDLAAKSAGLEEMDRFWEEAKRGESSPGEG